ncbi:antibiotic biosynthesis monooxygenase family protein [Calycomorphotria hydatis]|uniref:Antibiotic biosynthesis monooxygenase n=1 Tax=Calycomorphotria hydatis TaxID=2528027 RepID=A0A517T7G0_9PLAN|nr:antibiotic biosynthesis monooxygenase family protein [Calycomorphotria hydatis]QDT64312.1 Antibiotic biosynthesis monooxygenase [Calycomorphotria hydatis]
MTTPTLVNSTTFPTDYDGPVVRVNVFTPKEGMLDALINKQKEFFESVRGTVTGFLGIRLHPSMNGSQAISYLEFKSAKHYQAWRQSSLFAELMATIEPLIDTAEPPAYGRS